MTKAVRTRGRWVEVSADDIAKATRNNSRHCAVAVAIHRLRPDARAITVDISTIRYSKPKQRKRFIFITPARVQEYIAAFDAGKKIEPFSFSMPHEAFVHPMAKVDKLEKTAGKTLRVKKATAKVKAHSKGPTKHYVVEGRKGPPQSKRAKEYRIFGRRVLRENWPQHAHGVVVP